MKPPILLDGPMGTEIDRRGGDISLPLWSARVLIENPEMVRQIHRDYIDNGADVITTNTFRTQQYTLKKAGANYSSQDLTKLAVELAQESKHQKTLIAGSIAPVEDCYSPHLTPSNSILEDNFSSLITTLVDTGVDILLVETMNSLRETDIALELAKVYDVPIWLSFTCAENGNILSGESWGQAFQKYIGMVDLIAVNCSSVQATDLALKQFPMDITFGFYPNFGMMDEIRGWSPGIVGDDYHKLIDTWLDSARMVGTCCGATPKDTNLLRQRIGQMK